MSFRTRYNSRFSQYLTKCVSCARNTSKSFAKLHDGQCKNCSQPRCGAAYNEHCMTPGKPCGTHMPVDSRSGRGLVCPDCGEHTLTAYQRAHHYHCDACTRQADPMGYYNEVMGRND